MKSVGIALFGWMVFCVAVPLTAQKKEESSFLKIANIRYATHAKADPKLNTLNVYIPKKGSNSPMVIWIHGGSLAFGDKDNVLYKAEYFTARGYVFASINYRVSPSVKHPTNAQDVADAIVWLHGNATDYSADPEKIFLIGHSAGAQLAALVSVDEKYLAKSGSSPAILDGVILLDGLGYDIPLLMKDASSKVKEWCVEAFGKTRKEWEQASVINSVKENKLTPPFMIAYAGEREAAEKEAIAFSRKLSEARIKNKVFAYEKKNTSSINKELGKATDKPTEDVLRFLQEIHYVAINPIR